MNGTADGTVNHVKCFPGTIPTGVFLGYHHTLNTNELNVF